MAALLILNSFSIAVVILKEADSIIHYWSLPNARCFERTLQNFSLKSPFMIFKSAAWLWCPIISKRQRGAKHVLHVQSLVYISRKNLNVWRNECSSLIRTQFKNLPEKQLVRTTLTEDLRRCFIVIRGHKQLCVLRFWELKPDNRCSFNAEPILHFCSIAFSKN